MSLAQAQQIVSATGDGTPTATPTPGTGGFPDYPGDGGGASPTPQPSGGGGGITLPFGGTDTADSGLYGSDVIPTDYQPVPGFPGIFYSRAAGRFGVASAGTDIYGTPKFKFHEATKAEQTNILAYIKANPRGDPSYLSYGGAGVDTSQFTYPGGGGVTADQQAQLAYDYAALQQKATQDAATNALQRQQLMQTEIGGRASTGIQLGDLARGLANDQYNEAKDPGNYPAYLASSADMPIGAGSPIDALLGRGIQILPPAGGNPLADPRFQNLIGQEYQYAQPGSLQTVEGIAAGNGGTLPQSFYDYTGTQNPNAPIGANAPAGVPTHAQGGTQMLNEPVIGIGLHSGQPKFLAGEAGQEKLEFTPVHSHNDNTGKIPIPHMHAGGDVIHEHAGPNAPASFKHYAMGGDAQTAGALGGTGIEGIAGEGGASFTPHQLIGAYNAYHPNAQMADTTFTPSEATNMSLGKALRPLGYVPQYVIQQLLSGRAPTPGSIGENWYAQLPQSYQDLLAVGVKAQVGSTGLADYNQRLQQDRMPALSNAAWTGVSYI